MGAGQHQVARDISYASSASSKGGRAVIRVLENATGRLKLIKRAEGYDEEVAMGRDFWEVITDRYGLTLDVIAGSLDNIPKEGPLVLISNHPYGILDGVMMGHILSRLRGDFRILANSVFRRSEALERYVLPISFDATKEAQRVNVQTRKFSLNYLAQGGAIGVFPGGTVATARKPFATPMDPAWRTFTAKMITKSKATVVPIYFEGHNSRLFQIASHLHNTLRLALLISEFRTRVDEPVKIAVGHPIPQDLLDAHASDPKSMMDFLRNQTYALSPKPLKSTDYGYEFEERWKS